MKLSFGKSKFINMLLAGTLVAIAPCFIALCDGAILGHVIGEDALAGVYMVLPVLSAVTFFSRLIAVGTSINYLITLGRNNRRRASEFFMQGVWIALIIGILMSIAVYFFWDSYINFIDGSEYVSMYAEQYMRWAWPISILECIFMMIVSMSFVDGDVWLCTIALVVSFIVKAVVSYVAADTFGMGASAGALGTIVAFFIGSLIAAIHFIRKTNTLKVVTHFSFKDVFRICHAAFANEVVLICNALLYFVLVKLVICKFGSDELPAAGVAILLWNLLHILGGVGFAVQPIVAVYHGERNTKAISSVMKCATYVSLIEGLGFTILALAFPDAIISISGVEYPDVVENSRVLIRIFSLGMIAFAISFLYRSYYLFVEQYNLSFVACIVCHAIFPILCMYIGAQFGLNGVWVGLAIGPILGLLAISAFIILWHGHPRFPLMLDQSHEAKTYMFNLRLCEREITNVSKAVANLLRKTLPIQQQEMDVESVAVKASLLVEEVFMAVKERNSKRHKILGEVTIDLNDGVVITLRDDGKIFNITDADQEISSLRSYLVASMMEKHDDRMNIFTTGFNRNVFRF